MMRTTPTGIDRVELTYAEMLLRRIPERLSFAARYPYGLYGRLETGAVRRFLLYTASLWQNGEETSQINVRLAAVRHLITLRPRSIPQRRGRRVFLQVSPHLLDQVKRTEQILRREDAKFVCMVHDLIPILHAEFARPNGAEQHRRRIESILTLAAGVIANSQATCDELASMAASRESGPVMRVAHLGTALTLVDATATAPLFQRPYFVCVGTIEPRKNHLLLLNLWRRMAQESGEVPALFLVGRRGWENEQVVDMLERCEPLKGHVFEYNDLSDHQMAALTRNARAMLLPSFAEGFGMPVAEALAAGVPVIAADIPAYREVGRDVPDYLDPIAGLDWLAAIKEYASATSPARLAQLRRMHGWTPVAWDDHLDVALDLIDSI